MMDHGRWFRLGISQKADAHAGESREQISGQIIGDDELLVCKQGAFAGVVARRNRGQNAALTRRWFGQQRLPDLAAWWIRLHEGLDRAAANQTVVPAEIVIEDRLECEGFARFERAESFLARLGFEATAAERPDHAA